MDLLYILSHTQDNTYHDIWCTNHVVLVGMGNTNQIIDYVQHPLSYFSFQPVLHDWCNKDRGMCYPVCGMVHIKEPLLLIDKSSLCGGSGFPLSLSEWSLTMSDAI